MALLHRRVANHVRVTESATQWKERYRRLDKLKYQETYTTGTDVAESSVVKQQQRIMDGELWEAAKNGDVDNFLTCLEKFTNNNDTPISTIFTQLTVGDEDTFLHVAASYGHEDLAGFIADDFRELLNCRNYKGDSALHLAARAGHFGVVAMFLRVQQIQRSNQSQVDQRFLHSYLNTDEDKEELLKRRLEERVAVNNEGNTALHEAMLHGHKDVASCIIDCNVEASYYANKQGMSPLFMAVESADTEHVRNILHGKSEFMHLLNVQLIKGKSLLHAAVSSKSIEILQEIATQKPILIGNKDEDGLSPLDFATSTGFLEGVDFLQALLIKVTNDTDAMNVNQNFHKKTRDIRIQDIRPSQLWEGRNERLQRLILQTSPDDQCEPESHQPMSLELYICAKKGDIDAFVNSLSSESNPVSVICNQQTPLRNTFLHVAASFGNEDLAGFIVYHFRKLLGKKNQRGDTALHVAAAAGHLGVVDILLTFQIDQMKKDLLLDVDIESNNETVIGKLEERVMLNDDGNTSLHEALMHDQGKVAEYLIKEKIEDSYYVNKQGKSALYMAIEANNIDHVKAILSARLSSAHQHIQDDDELTTGKSLVRAALKSRNIDILQEITKMKNAGIQMKDEIGQTPLHYAASINFPEGVLYLLDRHKLNTVEKDCDGFLPIHCASKYGHVGILTKFLMKCLDARELVNEDCQNILHVAAEYGKYGVVRYILKTPGLELLLNEKDKRGNTPLHLAAMNCNPKVVSCLTWDKRIDLKVVNKKGLTALEVGGKNIAGMNSYRSMLTRMALLSAGAENKPLELERLKSDSIELWKDRVNTLLLVSTLIATVTFAAVFTMPGGYKDSEPDHGIATLLNKLAFQVFVICDTMAMYSAILVSVTLIWAQLGVYVLVVNSLRLALPLLGISLTMMSFAFMAAVYVVVSKLVWLSVVVLIMGILFFACLLTLFIPLIVPHYRTGPIARYLNYVTLCFLMLASGNYFESDVKHD